MKNYLLCMFMLVSHGIMYAQHTTAQTPPYNPHDFFTESFNPPQGNLFRSANGTPGPQYWQNSASYLIHAELNETDTSITGDVVISYTNNSPDKLDYLWLQLDQNLFNPASRGTAAIPASGDEIGVTGFEKGGYNIAGVTVTQDGKTYKVKPIINDTRMQVRLNSGLPAKGGKVSVKINYSFFIPAYGADRMGRLFAKNTIVYTIAQWYPRMCVYDDLEGWNTLPYMGLGEFYCEYGNFDYYITAPSSMIIYGSGDLQNPAEVLTAEQIKRLTVAAASNNTTAIIKADEIGKALVRPSGKSRLTWHFTMKNTRDVAWAASSGMVWDAAKINLPSGRRAIAMSAYPPESVGDTAWSRSTEYLKTSIEIYSKDFFEFPWNTAINIGSNITGMEYPGIVFNDYAATKAPLWFVTAHEIGHNWFPMVVGSNERRYMWQDEGFNSYINYYANDIFNKGEYAKDPALFSKEHFAYLDQEVLPSLKDPLSTVSEAMDYGQHFQYYSKTAVGLKLLRTVVIGPERFDYAFKKYIEAWAYKHPTPYDFFHAINSGTGEDLNWFWKEWFFTTWTHDQAITGVTYILDDPAKGSLITIVNNDKMILPVIIKVSESNGTTATVHLPAEVWQRGGTWTFKYPSVSKIDKVVIDPENVLPDINRKNNTWGKK